MTAPTLHPTPWLSILVPFHNVEAYIEECGQDVEIILCDDCSTDASLAKARELVERHPAIIRLLVQQSHQGVSATRNALVESASGEYYWFVDADDTILPGAVTALHAIVDQWHPDVISGDIASAASGNGHFMAHSTPC